MSVNWNPVWHQAISHRALFGVLQGKKNTVTWDVPAYVSGSVLRIRFSNIYGKKPYKVGNVSVAVGTAIYDVTLGGKKSFRIPTGGQIWSDEIPVTVSAGDTMNVRLYYKTNAEDSNMTEEFAAKYRGNHTKDKILPDYKMADILASNGVYNEVPMIDQIDLGSHQEDPAKVIAVFGDSITSMNRWVKPLQKRLYEEYKGEYVAVNCGILGNCLIYEVPGVIGKLMSLFGEMGVKRFQRDVLDIENLDTLFFCLGTNDTSYVYSKATRKLITFENLTKAITDCADKAHAQGARVVFQTISPRYGYTNFPAGPYTEEMDTLRRRLNDWAKTAPCFDAVVDTAAVTEDPEKPGWYREDMHQGDHLHPSTKGGIMIADAMDLSAIVGK